MYKKNPTQNKKKKTKNKYKKDHRNFCFSQWNEWENLKIMIIFNTCDDFNINSSNQLHLLTTFNCIRTMVMARTRANTCCNMHDGPSTKKKASHFSKNNAEATTMQQCVWCAILSQCDFHCYWKEKIFGYKEELGNTIRWCWWQHLIPFPNLNAIRWVFGCFVWLFILKHPSMKDMFSDLFGPNMFFFLDFYQEICFLIHKYRSWVERSTLLELNLYI